MTDLVKCTVQIGSGTISILHGSRKGDKLLTSRIA